MKLICSNEGCTNGPSKTRKTMDTNHQDPCFSNFKTKLPHEAFKVSCSCTCQKAVEVADRLKRPVLVALNGVECTF